MKKVVLAVLVLIGCSGCMTLVTRGMMSPELKGITYPATRIEARFLTNAPKATGARAVWVLLWPLYAADLAVSATTDTLFYPLDNASSSRPPGP